MNRPTMTVDELADTLGYVTRRGVPSRPVVLALVRDGKLPPPIDDTISVRRWRWSRAEVDAYVNPRRVAS